MAPWARRRKRVTHLLSEALPELPHPLAAIHYGVPSKPLGNRPENQKEQGFGPFPAVEDGSEGPHLPSLLWKIRTQSHPPPGSESGGLGAVLRTVGW